MSESKRIWTDIERKSDNIELDDDEHNDDDGSVSLFVVSNSRDPPKMVLSMMKKMNSYHQPFNNLQ